jgi:uncharacterized protein (DUF1697 family)
MTRYIAFLRAINVGGRNVKMDSLRRLFASFGFSEVETYIASGNVIFQAASGSTAALEEKIAASLYETLGFEVATFIRTDSELARIAQEIPFSAAELEAAAALTIAYLHVTLDERLERKLMGLKTDIDDFALQGREVYWKCIKKQSESKFSNAVLEKTLGMSATMRGINTVRKMAAKYGPTLD